MAEAVKQAEKSAPERPVVVSAVGLTKVFRDFWNRPKAKAVNDIDFEVREGEVVGLLGPNGSGKSTTVKMLLGLLYPTGGRLTVFGKSPRDVENKKLIGYLPEETYLYKYLTAFETLDFFASLFGLSKEERTRRCDQLLDMVGLAHARNRPVGEFSKGIARRIGLAQAMINDPAFLILDEPTSGLDPLGCREVKDLIKLLKKRGKTVIVTSHLLSDVEEVCDRIIVLYGGRIRANGGMEDLLTIRTNDTITVPRLPEDAIERIRQIVRESVPDGEMFVAHPHMSLEDFFVDIVNEAKKESLETSGSRSGGAIADYLTGDKEHDAKAVLESLTREEETPAQTLAKKMEEDAAKAAEDAAKKRQDELFAKLQASAPAPEEEKSRREQQEIEEKMSEANRKLKDLLTNPTDRKD